MSSGPLALIFVPLYGLQAFPVHPEYLGTVLPDFLMITSGLSTSSGERGPSLYRAGEVRSEELFVKGPFAVAADFVKYLVKSGRLLRAS